MENPGKVSTFYGENVFHRDTMREFLQEDIFEKVMEAVQLWQAGNESAVDRANLFAK